MSDAATAFPENRRPQTGAVVPCYVCGRTFEAPSEGYCGALGDLCHDCMGHLIGIFEDHLIDAAMRRTPDKPELVKAMEVAIGQEVFRLDVLLLVATGKVICRVHRPSGELEFTAADPDEPKPALLS